MKAKQKTRQWTQIGWQGIRFPILAEWHLARVQGDRNKGYLRVDDDLRVRLELRWEKPAKRPGDFSEIAAGMLAQVEKFGRKKKTAYTLKRETWGASPPDKEFECFETRGEGVSYGCLMRCRTCGRTILGQVLGKPREDLKTIARRVFETLSDHPGEDDLDHWEVYDLRFSLPPRYRLQRTGMRTGALEMQFTDRKTEVDVRRFSLAGILLKEHTLKSFFIDQCYKELRQYDYQSAEVAVKGHDHGVALTGPKTLRARVLSNIGAKRYVHGYAWVCNDKIYMFRMTAANAEEPLFFQLAEHIRCH